MISQSCDVTNDVLHIPSIRAALTKHTLMKMCRENMNICSKKGSERFCAVHSKNIPDQVVGKLSEMNLYSSSTVFYFKSLNS